jgi:hypothetical protein
MALGGMVAPTALLICASANAQSTTGAPLASDHCKPNLYIVVSANPDALLKAWNKRDVWMFGDEADQGGGRTNVRARATRIVFNETRDLTSALIMVDSSRARGVNFMQLASYIAMLGLAEIRADADVAEAPSIMHLFSRSENDRPPGLSSWDEAFLKALYHTEQTDKQQLGEIKTTMIEGLLPR